MDNLCEATGDLVGRPGPVDVMVKVEGEVDWWSSPPGGVEQGSAAHEGWCI